MAHDAETEINVCKFLYGKQAPIWSKIPARREEDIKEPIPCGNNVDSQIGSK